MKHRQGKYHRPNRASLVRITHGVETGHLDAAGNRISIGDCFVFSAVEFGSATLRFGRVVELSHGKIRGQADSYAPRIRSHIVGLQTHGGETVWSLMNLGTVNAITRLDRVLVVPKSAVPRAAIDLLQGSLARPPKQSH